MFPERGERGDHRSRPGDDAPADARRQVTQRERPDCRRRHDHQVVAEEPAHGGLQLRTEGSASISQSPLGGVRVEVTLPTADN
jgi:hypothetical protein